MYDVKWKQTWEIQDGNQITFEPRYVISNLKGSQKVSTKISHGVFNLSSDSALHYLQPTKSNSISSSYIHCPLFQYRVNYFSRF